MSISGQIVDDGVYRPMTEEYESAWEAVRDDDTFAGRMARQSLISFAVKYPGELHDLARRLEAEREA